MKISKEGFESMQKKYDKEVKKGGPGQDKNEKGKSDPTKWIFFDGGTLEALLKKAEKDPKKGGIQFHFTEYIEEVATKFYPNEVEKVARALSLVIRPANLKEDEVSTSIMGTEEDYANRGTICPPFCDPEPTNT